MGKKSDYRKDIDGLRAVAVLGVLLFHAKLGWLPGGFVGVDVFFVISGYLITGIIMGHEGGLGAFLAQFYERRIRRLIPPAIPVLAFTAAYAWYLLPPAALEEFSKSLIAYASFISNWFFLSIEGYFDGPSELKPLLHTWSLSIEEQFYLLFPIPILLLKRWGIGAVRLLLIGVFGLSLALSAYLVQTSQSDAAFYNSLARFWEIALGGLLAVNAIRLPDSPALRQSAGITGLGMIAAAMLLYSDRMPFPGLSALAPTVGAALVIMGKDGFTNRLLSTRPFVGVGLISYALYLWHWPIFVLIQHAVIGATPVHFLLGIAVSIALSVASYFLIEMPIRSRTFRPSKSLVFGSFAAASVAVLALGGTGWGLGGAPARFPIGQEYAANLLPSQYKTAEGRLRSVCWISSSEPLAPALDRCVTIEPAKENILLLGDSHAAQYYPALAALLPQAHISLIATDSCTLIRGNYATCNDLTAWVEQMAASPSIPFDQIIISTRVDVLPSAKVLAEVAKSLARDTTAVTVLGPIQYYRPGLPTLFPSMVDRFSNEQLVDAFNRAVQPDQFVIDAWLADAFQGTDVQYVSVLHMTCPTGPESCAHFSASGQPSMIDDTHLTDEAALSIAARVARSIPMAANLAYRQDHE